MNGQRMRYVVTSAPPNPNGDLHLGHLSGPFLGGDLLRRFLLQTGADVTYVSYADDFSSYVERRGSELGTSPATVAHVFGKRMEETLALANMTHDYFTHPLREGVHTEVVQRFFLGLWAKGVFRVRELPTFWCAPCARFLYEAEIRGACQWCGAPSDAFYCEACGRPQEPGALRRGHCTSCGAQAQLRMLRRIVFPLEDYRDRLAAHYADRPLRPRLRAYLDDMFSRPLPETTISRQTGYGIPVPLAGWKNHVLDTWYSGIWGYLGAVTAHSRALGVPDRAPVLWTDPSTEIVHFIGFDCSFSHALLWPALALAHGGINLPAHVITNEFYRLDGDKFSTSRNHAIWGSEFLRRVPADAMRFYLCLTGPEQNQTSFSTSDFVTTVDSVLVRGLQRWVDAVFRAAAVHLGSTVPQTPLNENTTLAILARSLPHAVADALSPGSFSPQRAAAAVAEAIEQVAVQASQLEGRGGSDRTSLLAANLEVLARLAAVAAPIMPAWSERVMAALRLPLADDFRRVPQWPESSRRFLPAGHRIEPECPPMFHGLGASSDEGQPWLEAAM